MKRKYLVISFASNFRTQTDEDDIPVVIHHTDRINLLDEMGYDLITVDNGVGFFKLRPGGTEAL